AGRCGEVQPAVTSDGAGDDRLRFTHQRHAVLLAQVRSGGVHIVDVEGQMMTADVAVARGTGPQRAPAALREPAVGRRPQPQEDAAALLCTGWPVAVVRLRRTS